MRAHWFVDGASYMNAVADALDNATEEIYIADWWLSPEIYMKRPTIDGDYWRLDKILQRKAVSLINNSLTFTWRILTQTLVLGPRCTSIRYVVQGGGGGSR